MDNKKVAKYALGFIGGKPNVSRYYNDDETKKIDIMTSESGVIKGIPTCATIGLCQTDIGLSTNGKKLRVELVAACDLNSEILGNILATISFDVMDTKSCAHGMLIPNVIRSYVKGTELKHVVLMSPVFWSKYQVLEDDDCMVAWLMVVPITDSEKNYIEHNGIAAFDSLLERKDADVINMQRKPIV
jgi:hypothetical protein